MKRKPCIAIYAVNALFVALVAGLFGLRSVSNAGVLSEWSSIQIFIFLSYTIGLFALLALFFEILLLTYPLVKELRKTVLTLFILIDSSLLIFSLTDSFVYPLYRTHLNFAMIQMTLFGGGRIVSFSPRMLADDSCNLASLLLVCKAFILFFKVQKNRLCVFRPWPNSFCRFKFQLFLGVCKLQ